MVLRTSVALSKELHDKIKSMSKSLDVNLEVLVNAAVSDWIEKKYWQTWVRERAQKLVVEASKN